MSDAVRVGTVPIAELVDACERMASINRALFERLGGWVADESDPSRQQWFAVACHRHAWHADLWSERRPDLPLEATSVGGAAGEWTEPDDRATWYADRLSAVQAELAAIESGIDPVLDPSTLRVITLVAADLATLAASAPT